MSCIRIAQEIDNNARAVPITFRHELTDIFRLDGYFLGTAVQLWFAGRIPLSQNGNEMPQVKLWNL
jgi:hypothetical protein